MSRANIKIETKHYGDCTIGRLTFKQFRCFTLELPWLTNCKSVSCIPSGVYPAVKHKSPKNGDTILLQNVTDRTHIQIHAGNYTRQIEGCILVGDSIKYLDADSTPDVTNSKTTLSKLLGELGNDFAVEIHR